MVFGRRQTFRAEGLTGPGQLVVKRSRAERLAKPMEAFSNTGINTLWGGPLDRIVIARLLGQVEIFFRNVIGLC